MATKTHLMHFRTTTFKRLSNVTFPVCLTISWNIFVLLSVSNSNGEPNSTTRPASITKTLSESMTASVCGSTLAVASSITKMRFSRNIARAKQTNCLWPTLKLEPPSDILLCRPLAIYKTQQQSNQ
uniref:Uncharacterized protein n=1 Tax=Glossina austeni TaxID=7395 RepID=A0A1A9VAF5_GLOAU